MLEYDNGKVVFNCGFLLLADHYGFLPRACRPRRARRQGKVERMVKYLKENFFRPVPPVRQLSHVNQLLEQWMADVTNSRRTRRFEQTPEQRFTQEQVHLQALPGTDFDTSYFNPVMSPGMAISRLAGTVTACRKACVASRYQYGSGWMMNCGSTVIEQQVASHRLCSAVYGWQTVPEHHAPLWRPGSQVERAAVECYGAVVMHELESTAGSS